MNTEIEVPAVPRAEGRQPAPDAPRKTESTAYPSVPRAEGIKKELTAAGIAQLLPHRYPFALVDRILDYEPGQWAIGRKCVTINELFFCGHFPGQPVMPGVLLLEALAQVGAVAILSEEENKGKLVLFGGVKNARFRRQVTPGDVVELRCELTARHGTVGSGKATALLNGRPAVTAELTFAVADRQG